MPSSYAIHKPFSHDNADTIHLVVLTGMSGSGKSVALRALEDLEFYCVDNLPPALLPPFLRISIDHPIKRHLIAIGVDARSSGEDLQHMPDMLSELAGKGINVHLVFIDCSDEILVRRYSETRRRHPMAQQGVSLSQAIAMERQLLRFLMQMAEKVIDTSKLNVHQLRQRITHDYAQDNKALRLMFQSFAFRNGLPRDSDFIFDTRCLPNPHWEPQLRPLSGKDDSTRHFLEAQPMVSKYLADTTHWLENWLPRFAHSDRSYITISLGCTGGRHRSVYLVERLAAHFRNRYSDVISFHREIE